MSFPPECEEYEQILVSKHPNLADYLIMHNVVNKDIERKDHVRPEDIHGKHVIGVLPLSMACHAALYTEIPLRIDHDKRNQVMSIDEIGYCIQKPRTFRIEEVK